MSEVLTKTDLPEIPLFKRGKVRDIYEVGGNLLIVSTDRISAFDCVLSEGIPLKGKVLNQLSAFWFNKTKHIVPNHVVSVNPEDFPSQLSSFKNLLEKRAMLVRKVEPIKVECVVRRYLSGSAYKEYRKTGKTGGINLPPDLKESDPLSQPIFTPATKQAQGHDVNITFSQMQDRFGKQLSTTLKDISLNIYQHAAKVLDSRGFILADTKFEFGMMDGKILLIDEVLTPDSSRFWLKENYTPGAHQESFDKQFVRDYLESLDWDKTPPPPPLPRKIVEKTSKIYQETYQKITGESILGS